MNTKNTASQPNVVSIGDDAQFQALLDRFFITSNWGSTQIRAEIVAHLDSKLRAPADQAASVAREYYFRADACKAKVPTDTDCICWHAEGTGPMANYPAGIGTWRNAAPQQSLAPAADKIEIPSNEELDELYEAHVGHPADFAADVLERWGGWPMGILGQGGSGVLPVAAEGQVSAAAPARLTDEQIMRIAGDVKHRNAGVWPGEVAFVRAIERASEGQAQTSAAVEDWRHAANEWADTAYNGLQWLKNIEDGITTDVKAARENLESCCKHSQEVADAAQLADSTGGVKS
jgi:hypothetical protein